MPHAFDDERDPVVLIRLHGWLEGSDLEQTAKVLDGLLGRERDFALVLDCGDLQVPELAQIQVLAGWFGQNFEAANHWLAGVAFVVTKPLLRSTLETAMRMQRMPVPLSIFATAGEGLAWAQAKLDPSRSGRYRMLPPEPELESFRERARKRD